MRVLLFTIGADGVGAIYTKILVDTKKSIYWYVEGVNMAVLKPIKSFVCKDKKSGSMVGGWGSRYYIV